MRLDQLGHADRSRAEDVVEQRVPGTAGSAAPSSTAVAGRATTTPS